MFITPITVGQKASRPITFSQDEFDRFARLSGDNNPIHVDPVFAARTRFGKPVAHGMLLYSVICAELNNNLPGNNAQQLFQELIFPNPTFAAEKLSIQLEVVEVDLHKGLVKLSTQIVKPDNSPGLLGSTLIQLPESVNREINQPQSPDADDVNREITHKGLNIGQSAYSLRRFNQTDLIAYEALTGDKNPIYQIDHPSDQSGIAPRNVPPGLLGGLFSDLLGTQLPGLGTNWLKQKLYYFLPAHVGDEIRASVEIIRIRPEKDLVNLRTTCFNSTDEMICDGEALVYVKDLMI